MSACSSASSGNQSGQATGGFAGGGAVPSLGTGASGNSGGSAGSSGAGGAMSTAGKGSGGMIGASGTTATPGAGGSIGTAGRVGAGGAIGMAGTFGGGGVINTGGSNAAGGMIGMAGTTGVGGMTGPGCLKGAGDYSKAGPYTVATKSVDLASMLPNATAPTTYTIFYPKEMDASCPAPVIAWGNGTTVMGSQVYSFFNNNAASYGMVVIASDNDNSAASPFLPTGIDYMLQQNKDMTSEFYGKLSGRAGTSGHSQGGFAATTASSHAAVQAEVQVEGGGIPKKGIAFLALSGTADNVVGTMSPTSSYNAATGPSMLAIYTGADHISTPTIGGYLQMNAGTIQFMRFYTAWFRCFLADDANACAMFKGGMNCGVCKDPNWDTLKTKNM
jgi:hypothetical protein